MDAHSPEPDGPADEPRPTSAALLRRPKCPSCGREPAVVFPLLRDHPEGAEEAPLVCLDCCLDVRDRR